MVTRLLRYIADTEVTLFASAARTVTVNGSDVLLPPGAKGMKSHLDVTVVSGTTPTLDVKLQAKINGIYIDVPGAAFPQKTGVSTDDLEVYPGIAATANERVSATLPTTIRAVATIGGTTPSFTFSLKGQPIL